MYGSSEANGILKEPLNKCVRGALRIFSATTSLGFLEINTIIPAKSRLVVAKNPAQIALAGLSRASLKFLSSRRAPVHILVRMGKRVFADKGAIKMEKNKTAPAAGTPQQDVDDLIFFGQTDAQVSQR